MGFRYVSSILIVFLSAAAYAQISMGNLKSALSTEYKAMTFSFDAKTQSYILNNVIAHVSGTVKVDGVMKRIFNSESLAVNETIQGALGKNIRGYSRLKLQNEGGKIILACDTQVADAISGFPLSVSSQALMPAKLVQGTWDEYQKGGTVALELTPEGNAAYNKAMNKGLSTLFDNAFGKGFQDLNVKTAVNSVVLAKNVRLKANLKEIEVEPILTDYDITVFLGL